MALNIKSEEVRYIDGNLYRGQSILLGIPSIFGMVETG